MLLGSIKSYSQTGYLIDSAFRSTLLYRSGESGRYFTFLKPVDTLSITVNKVGKSREVLKYVQSTDKVLYKPSMFCDCRKCRKFKGYKELNK